MGGLMKYINIYIGGLMEYIYPKKLQFAAHGQFVLVFSQEDKGRIPCKLFC